MSVSDRTSGTPSPTEPVPPQHRSGATPTATTPRDTSGSGRPQGGGAGAEENARSPHWRLRFAGLVIALVMTTIMVTTYVQAEHGVVAHDLPWGEVGSSPLTAAVQKKVSLQIHNYASEQDLVNAANNTTIYGGFVAKSNSLIISEAASLWAPGVMPAAYLKAAKALGVKLSTFQTPKVINTLPKQDPEGVVPGLVTFVLLVAGYLAATLAMQRTGRAAAHRRVISLAVYSVVAALVFDVIVGPILGAYPDVGSNFWPLWGEFALMILAVALLAATLQSLIGPMGTLLTVIIVVFFGNPSTGGVNGTAYLPPFWQFLGPILPPWNSATLIRNTLYFHGNAITQQIVVLGIYVVIGAVLVELFSWARLQWWRNRPEAQHRKPVISPEEEAGVAAMPPA